MLWFENKKITGRISYLLWLALSVRFLEYTYSHTVNGPFCDDILTILFPVNALVGSGIKSYLHELVALHNEHKVLTLKLIAGLYYYIFSEVNFKTLCLIGDVIFCLIPPLLVGKGKSFWLIVVSLLFFTPRVNGSALWAMTALSNFMVIFLAIIALRAIDSTPRLWNAFGGILIFLCVMTQGNGLIYGLLILIYAITRNGLRPSLSAILFFFISLYAYFYEWHANQDPLHLSYSYLDNAVQLVLFFFAVLGSLIPQVEGARILGVLMFFFYILLKSLSPLRNRLSFYDVVIVGGFLSAAMITPNRVFLGPEAAVVSRYAILSLAMLSALLMEVVQDLNIYSNKIEIFVLSMAIMFYSWSWFNLNDKEMMPFYVGQSVASTKGSDVRIEIGCGVDTRILEDIVEKSLLSGVYVRH